MVMTDPKTETSSDSKPRIEEAPLEKLGDSSTVLDDPVESRSPKEEEEKETFGVCVEEAKKKKEDIVTKCREVSTTLCECVDAHFDYYEPILIVAKVFEEETKKEMEAEKNKVQEEDISEEEEASSGLLTKSIG
ncbi:BnaA09g38300D [Brassica napus]|uniref:(rape) hypothetical protein n=1 Tax=Brassica napus TaxID=3708 RepID=A0A078HRH3_BRANA|nr:uncharacterized protein LOC111200618 [Brassica napus]CAF2048748.1 unnamed protein product [Brassica napus]CDY41185.1 BnaA09g38300D [Brassica napus]